MSAELMVAEPESEGRMALRGLAVDTYQAIWGPDPAFPGNRLVPIGWRVRRPAKGAATAIEDQP